MTLDRIKFNLIKYDSDKQSVENMNHDDLLIKNTNDIQIYSGAQFTLKYTARILRRQIFGCSLAPPPPPPARDMWRPRVVGCHPNYWSDPGAAGKQEEGGLYPGGARARARTVLRALLPCSGDLDPPPGTAALLWRPRPSSGHCCPALET